MAKWQVIVGNIGTTYDGTNGFEARQNYSEYKRQSNQPVGRAAGESVTLMKDNEPYWEHHGTIDNDSE